MLYDFPVQTKLPVIGSILDHSCDFITRKITFPGWIQVIALLMWIAPLPANATPVTSFLHARGQDIVNEQGDKVLLRGIGLGNWMLPEGYMWKFGNLGDRPRRIEKIVSDLIGPENAARFWTAYRMNYITEADIQRIAQLGYNSVRPALNSRLFLDENGKPDHSAEGFSLLDNLIRWCQANGVYVIIDMHAAPGGQTGQNIDDSANDQPELFMQQKYQDELVGLWKAIAQRYKDEPAVAGFDLLNEPLPERTGAAKTFKAQLEPLYKRITRVIREIDSKHIIILEGADWANDWSVFTSPFDKNLVYQFHYYCWDNPTTLKSIRQYLRYRNRLDAPVWVGETGEKDNAIYWATTEYFEANNIGWSFWPWKKMDTQNTPCSVKIPAGWDAVTAYSRGGEKPSRETAQKAFDGLLVNIRLDNCVFFPDVVDAMLRRAPAKIEGENYGQDGQNKSYFVKNPNQRSKYYRTSEPVLVNPGEPGRRQSSQYITLAATEWTSYAILSQTPDEYRLTVRAKAEDAPTEVQIVVDDQIQTVTIPSGRWSEIDLANVALAPGLNHLKWLVKSGVADLDWLKLSPVGNGERTASSASPVLFK